MGALRCLAKLGDVTLSAMLESPEHREANEELIAFRASVERPVRAVGNPGRRASVTP